MVVKWFCVPGETRFETVTKLAGRGQRAAGWLFVASMFVSLQFVAG